MKNVIVLLGFSVFLCVAVVNTASAQTTHRKELSTKPPSVTSSAPTAFQNNDGNLPDPKQYSGPLFSLSHNWPQKPLPPIQNPPWQAAIGGQPINIDNANAYADALREYVSKNAKQLIMNYESWDASKAGWYNEPWLGSLRESIHGTYPAGEFGPSIFPDTGLRAKFNTHVLTYYDERAAYSLFKLWSSSAKKPAIETKNSQFDEGSVIVKAAIFASMDANQKTGWWDAMAGAQEWPLFISQSSKDAKPEVWPGYVAQFDIIVKDSKSSPQTGWVFTTLVYDGSLPGDVWDKMIPLGVQWGNDPQATTASQPLVENWINPRAPKYSTQTLGWGGRLSGPNDGARNDISIYLGPGDWKVEINAPDSSCMSCHSTAQTNPKTYRMDSFLMPSFPQKTKPYFQLCGDDGKPNPKGNNICSPKEGSLAWMKWFKNRVGTKPMDLSSVAMDFDLVFSFKSIPMWWSAMGNGTRLSTQSLLPNKLKRFNDYTGAPLK